MPGQPQIVGILNLTEDSFSDGGRFLAPEAARLQARALAEAGADILELGPASSHPDAAQVPARDQIDRLESVWDAIADLGRPISVDATDPDVLRFALGRGAAILNDVRGFPDRGLCEELAGGQADLVVVHSLLALERATRDAFEVATVLDSIERFFEARLTELVALGVKEERLILDPGMGFFLGSRAEASLAVLQRITELRTRFGRPLFISVSRKSFLRTITGRELAEIGAATLAAELYAARAGADYLRTHDVAALRDGLAVEAALKTPAVDASDLPAGERSAPERP